MNQWEVQPGETPIDPSGLKDKSVRNRSQLYAAEFVNIAKATAKYRPARLRGARAFSYSWLLRVHCDMFGDVWTWAGEPRRVELNLGVHPHLVVQQLGGLSLDIAAWRQDETLLLEQSVMLHHRAVRIHPFLNGNGRWSRFIANLWLRRHGKPRILWPEPSLSAGQGGVRSEYLKAVRLADTFDYSALTELHARFWGK